jgi:hypothetical protein
VAAGGALVASRFSPPLATRTQRKLLALVAQPIF